MNFSSDPINTLENLIAKNKTKSFSIYLVLLVAILLFITALPIIKIDISSQSRGVIRSKTDNVPITTIVSGRVTWLALRNNKKVAQGDTLMKLSKQNLETEKNSQNKISDNISSLLVDTQKLLQGNNTGLKTAAAREDFLKYQAQKEELLSKVSQGEANYNRYKILYNKGILAKAEFEKHEYELRFTTQALQSYVNQQRVTWENQKRELEERIKNIEGTISKINVETHNYAVIAPISGTIQNFSGLQVDSYINASQPIATISAVDGLLVESIVAPNDIGLIHKDQKVKFQFDAFNYNQWGLLEGKVIDIDCNSTLLDNQPFFKVRCAINTTTIQLKSGYKAQLSKGMTLTTRYIIAKRSLFDLLFDKVDDWLNPKLAASVQ
jgi:multidrug resistance efflux pump